MKVVNLYTMERTTYKNIIDDARKEASRLRPQRLVLEVTNVRKRDGYYQADIRILQYYNIKGEENNENEYC